ncbi:MAG: hypothetical protein SGPRY_003473 [Prymnesium sp.]
MPYDLIATDESIEATASLDPLLWSNLAVFKVFARMSPQGKAKVIRMLQERSGRRVLMCGDGGNDVGALKQSDVGLALLSGYGNVNTSDAADPGKAGGGGGRRGAEEALNLQAKELARKRVEAAKIQHEALKQKRMELQASSVRASACLHAHLPTHPHSQRATTTIQPFSSLTTLPPYHHRPTLASPPTPLYALPPPPYPSKLPTTSFPSQRPTTLPSSLSSPPPPPLVPSYPASPSVPGEADEVVH